MTEAKRTIEMAVKVDRTDFDAFAEKVEKTAALARGIQPRDIGNRLALVLALALASAVLTAGYFIEQRTEQTCLAAGNAPDACRSSLGDL